MNIEIGKINSLRLDNGLGVFVCQNKKAPIATFQAWVTTGSVNEGQFIGSGLSHFLEHMVFKGTRNFSKRSITAKIDKIGGRINAYTSYCNTVFHVNSPSSKIIQAAEIITDLVRNPIFPSDEFKTEKDVIVRERAMRSDIPDAVLIEKLLRTMFRSNPIRHPIIGYENMILGVSRDDLVNYHSRRYRPENIFIVACGDLEASEIFDFVRKKCDDWENSTFHDDPIPIEHAQQSLREENFIFKDPLSRIAVAFHTPELSDPASPVMDTLGVILGGNESSRLTKKIEKKKQLSVSIDCSHYGMPFGGIICAVGTTSPEKLEPLKESIIGEMNAITNTDPPKKDEIDKVVRQLSAEFIKSLRSVDAVGALLGRSVMNYGDPSYALRYLDQIRKITPDKALETASRFIRKENCTIVKMLPDISPKTKTLISSKTKAHAKYEKIILEKPEGLPRTLILTDKTLPLFDIAILGLGGTILESNENVGIGDMTALCMPCGTTKYNEDEISEFLDYNAIDLSLGAGNNTFSISLTAEKDRFQSSIEILEEILRRPTFPESAVSREVKMSIHSIESERLSPRRAASELTRKIIYGQHPYALIQKTELGRWPNLQAQACQNSTTKNVLTWITRS